MNVKVHFELTEEEYSRAEKYISQDRYRHQYGHDAFMEWVKRKEGRDLRAREEQITKDCKYLQELINSGRLQL